MADRVERSPNLTNSRLFAYALALLAHGIWGSYPVISKFLLQSIPPFSLLALGYASAILLSLPGLRNTFREALRPDRLLRGGILLLMVAVTARSATNILSIKFTLAIYVQLINLLTPFAVALLGRILFREPVPPRTYPALLLSTGGSALILLTGTTGAIGGSWSSNDTLGIALALLSTLCLAMYMLLARHVQHDRRRSSPWEVLIQQMLALEAMALIGTALAGDDWGSLAVLPASTWGFFALFILINLLGGNLIQIWALRHLNTALFGSLLGTRLISALALAWLLLGERLTSYWQGLGAAVVVVTVTWYLRGQYSPRSTAVTETAPERT